MHDWESLAFAAILDGTLEDVKEEHARWHAHRVVSHADLVLAYAKYERLHEQTAAGILNAEALGVVRRLVSADALEALEILLPSLAMGAWNPVKNQIDELYNAKDGTIVTNPEKFERAVDLHNLKCESEVSVFGTYMRAGYSVESASALRTISKNGLFKSSDWTTLSADEQIKRLNSARFGEEFAKARTILVLFKEVHRELDSAHLAKKVQEHKKNKAKEQALIVACVPHGGPVDTVAKLRSLKLTREQLGIELSLKRKQFPAQSDLFKEQTLNKTTRKMEGLAVETVVAKFEQFLGSQYGPSAVVSFVQMKTAFAQVGPSS